MKRLILIFTLTQLIIINASANPVNTNKAKLVALNFFKGTSTNLPSNTSLSAVLKYTKTETDSSVDFYVFDMSQVKGFVIVSGEDAVEPVIAYSLESNFKLDNQANIGISDWINNSAGTINAVRINGTKADAQVSKRWSDYANGIITPQYRGAVIPLLTTTWNQSPYYNALCPPNCYTGCVATAMAQIMKYWNYPAKGTGAHTYTETLADGYAGTLSANLGATTYNWANMPNAISANNTDIATLMYQCGVAVEMYYGTSGSSASVYSNNYYPSAQTAYTSYFGYGFGYNPTTLQVVFQSSYTSANWISLLQNELNNNRPLQYAGSSGSGGHTWVCDGYDANNNFHMNWGWGGFDNGYYSLVNPLGYSNDIALIGIQPGSLSACSMPANLSTGNITLGSATFNWVAISGANGYNIQYRQVGASSWLTGSSSSASFGVSGLASSMNYEWEVQTVCSAGTTSAFTASSVFTTLNGLTCTLPSGLITSSLSGTSAILSWASTGASTYNLQWKAVSAGSWTTIQGITSPMYNLSGLTSCTGYQFQVQGNCNGTLSVYSSPFSFTTTGCNSSSSYCSATGSTTAEYINIINITSPAGAINNTSGDNKGYADFTNMNANIKGGTNITVNMTPGFQSGTLYKEYWTVYVDFNHNGSFTDAGEKVVTGNSTSKVSKRFTVPAAALNGPTRMRIVMQRGSYQANPCANFTYGEVEDYTVTITNNVSSPTPENVQDEQATTVKDLVIYPNPANDNITLQLLSDDIGNAKVSIYNLLGQKMLFIETPVAEGFNPVNLNTTTLSKGVYILETINNGITLRRKFIISR